MNLSLGSSFLPGLYQSACNMLEVLLAAVPLYPIIFHKPDLRQRKQLAAFLGYGVLMASAIAAFAASFAPDGNWGYPSWQAFHHWFSADALGMATVTPLYLAFQERQPFGGRSWKEILLCFGLMTLAIVAVFWQTSYPFLFVLLPFFLLLGVRLGLAGSALGLLLTAVIGGFLSTAGHGPIGLIRSTSLRERDLVLQIFLAISMLLVYVVEVLVSESRRSRAELEVSERRFRMLAEVSSDIIVLTDLDGTRNYVSPASMEMLGWKPHEVLGGNFREVTHPEDLAELERLFRECAAGGPPRPLEYRCRKADGSYLWLEINPRLHLDSNSGKPAGFVNVIRDISRRKLEEEQQQKEFETVEHMAWSDGLTGIANRRHFDVMLEREWLRAVREEEPLSVLLIDVDRFKPFNDLYGHVAGDECLREVVAAIKPWVNRPADFLARYGGEEFVVILPNTDVDGACQMAEWIRVAVEERKLPHRGNPPHAVITLSIGCVTAAPQGGMSQSQLLDAADRALYKAKSTGRNRIQLAEGLSDRGPALVSA
jgi:diguanylate cyclase (GGDEF)-like protein/PAS domain S-box-containing protein